MSHTQYLNLKYFGYVALSFVGNRALRALMFNFSPNEKAGGRHANQFR